MTASPQLLRHHKRGLVLLSTLVTLLVLASLVVAVQKRALANVQVMAKLTADLQTQADADAVYERMRGLVADAMSGKIEGRPKLNGESFAITEGGKQWLVRVQDVEGMVDIYLGSRDTLDLLPIDPNAFIATRSRALSRLQPGERFPTLAASLARFGVNNAALEGMVTQSSQNGSLRLATLAQPLEAHTSWLQPGVREGEQVVHVDVRIEQVGAAER